MTERWNMGENTYYKAERQFKLGLCKVVCWLRSEIMREMVSNAYLIFWRKKQPIVLVAH